MKKILLLIVLVLTTQIINAQDILFNETFGDGGSATDLRSITSYYAGTSPNTFQSAYPIVYSGEAKIGNPNTTSVYNINFAGTQLTGANLTVSNHLNSSSQAFIVMMSNAVDNVFKIENINTLNKTNIVLRFGLRVGRENNSWTNFLRLEQSIDGITWSPISFLAPPPNQWAYITCTTQLESNEFLKLRFIQEYNQADTNGFGTISIDDIKVTGISSSLNINNSNIETFKLYPNPVLSVLNIDNNLTNQPYNIIDTLGKVILKGNLNEGDNSINVEHLSKGIYYLKISDKNASKFIKE